MSSITSLHAERATADWDVPVSPAAPAQAGAEPVDDPRNGAIEWLESARQANPTLVSLGGETNRCPQIDSDCVALAKSAQKRWLRENPF